MLSRPVRSLEHLENTASTSRVLNLRALAARYRNHPEHRAKPMFRNPVLNSSIILKHRLRHNEHEDFVGLRRSATKILLPIETGDLRMGARYLFIGQKNFRELMLETFGIDAQGAEQDMNTLDILDKTPSLDPFLLREQLKRNGVDAAACYFDISEADMKCMFDFAQSEIQHLVAMSVGSDPAFNDRVEKLARKILMNSSDADLEPLRLTMQLSRHQYQEGIFCWKAFLYYKWRLTSVMPQLGDVISQIAAVTPRGSMDHELRAYLTGSRQSIRKTAMTSARKVRDTLGIYDEAYEAMTQRGDPLRFRDFLLEAPALFNDLGERLGAIDHITSFWRFRFPRGVRRPIITPEELADIFADFEHSLSFAAKTEPA